MADILYASKQQPHEIICKMLFQLICYQAITKQKRTSPITFMRIYNNWQNSAFIMTLNLFFSVSIFYYSYKYILRKYFGQTNICICFIYVYMHFIYIYILYEYSVYVYITCIYTYVDLLVYCMHII